MEGRMSGEFFLHVRRLPSGRVVGTPIPFTDLSVDGDSVEDVRSRARDAATSRLQEMPGVFRAALFDEVEVQLASARVKVSSGAGSEVVGITVGLVVVQRSATTGSVYVAYAPGMPRWSVAAESRERALSAAAVSLEDEFTHWPPGSAVALDQVGEISLERLSVASEPEAAQPQQTQIAGDDMVELARQGRLGRLDRLDPLVERVLAALAADGRASVLLVGQSDVGKTALVHEIAARLGSGDVPPGYAAGGYGVPRPTS
jgi:ATP-dependent Clp protease ATP-binding subunit ClpA